MICIYCAIPIFQNGDRIWRQFKNGENKDCSSSNFGHHDFCRPAAQTFGSSSPQRWSPARVACLLVLHMFGFHLPPSSVPLDTFVPSASQARAEQFYRMQLQFLQQSFSFFYTRSQRSYFILWYCITFLELEALILHPIRPCPRQNKGFWHQLQKGQRNFGGPSSSVTLRISCNEIISVM